MPSHTATLWTILERDQDGELVAAWGTVDAPWLTEAEAIGRFLSAFPEFADAPLTAELRGA